MRLALRIKAQAAVSSLCLLAGIALGAQFSSPQFFSSSAQAAEEPPHPAALDAAIIAAAKRHGVPERLVRRIIMRESKYNPKARNRAFWGLMQISYPTAQSMGFKGTREELLNPFVNLRYAVPYLANAFVIAGKEEDSAVRLYAAGYYFTAKSKGLLNVLRTANSPSLSGVKDEPPPPQSPPILAANAVVQPPQSIGFFGALFGPGRQPAPVAQAATYSATTAQADGAAPADTAAPAGTSTPVVMAADKNGDLAPPAKWARDGGTTLIARGEQTLEDIADHGRPDSDASRKSARRRVHKITLVAALDVPSTAQAYAAAPAQGATTPDPQSAIAQATAGRAAADQATAREAPGRKLATSPQPGPKAAPTAAKTRLAREVKRRKVAGETFEASAVKPGAPMRFIPPDR